MKFSLIDAKEQLQAARGRAAQGRNSSSNNNGESMDVLDDSKGHFRERSVAVGKQAALQKQLQELQRSHQVLGGACLEMLEPPREFCMVC